MIIGLALSALAIAAAFRVADTREGLIAEVVTLLGGLTGIGLLLYGLAARARPAPPPANRSTNVVNAEPRVRSANDLLIAASGVVVATILLSGLAISTGPQWALFGFVILLPMIAGSVYLGLRFFQAPKRVWRIDLRSLREVSRQEKHSDRDQGRGPDDVPVDNAQVLGEEQQTGDQQNQPEHR
jgi:hypothetical protein